MKFLSSLLHSIKLYRIQFKFLSSKLERLQLTIIYGQVWFLQNKEKHTRVEQPVHNPETQILDLAFNACLQHFSLLTHFVNYIK
jgi:hypothetical protein